MADPFKLLTEREVADWLQCSVYMLQRMRSRGNSIPYVKIGALVRYRQCDILAHIEQNTVVNSHANQKGEKL